MHRLLTWSLVAALSINAGRAAKRPQSFVDPFTGLTFVLIPAGAFDMGSPEHQTGHRADERLHRVVFTRPLYVSTTEVTQLAWRRIMGSNPSHFRGDEQRPVEQVTWNDVHRFLARLNARAHTRYRLPSEAEWEYACRAGTTTPFAFGSALTSEQANYDAHYPIAGQPRGTYRGAPSRVGSFPSNAWGVHDMHGNVWEWCEDDYCPYPSGPVTDPKPAVCASGLKVIRGGSWYFDAESARSALRYTHAPELRGFSLGFRIVRDAD